MAKKFVKKTQKRKRYNRSKRQRQISKAIPIGVPHKMLTKLRYFESINLTNSAGAGFVEYRTFRANSVFDPYYTGGGHQPRYFDQWMTMYQKCTVIGSKITVKWTSDENTSEDLVVITELNTDATTSADPQDILESRKTGYKTISPNNTPIGNVTRAFFDLKKMTSVSKPLSDSSLISTTSANPSQMWYYNLAAFRPSGSAAFTGTLTANVTIDYICVFHDPVNPTKS